MVDPARGGRPDTAGRLRILVVAERIPQPDLCAGDRRFFGLLEMMARRHHVDLYLGEKTETVNGADPRPYVDLLGGVGIRLPGPRPLASVLSGEAYDLGFFEFFRPALQFGAEFQTWMPHAPIIIDSVDVHFARESAGVRLGVIDRAEAGRRKQLELSAYQSADAVVVVSEDDGRVLAGESGMAPLFLLPLVLPERPRVAGPRAPEALFVGGFLHHPNVDGLTWFFREVWPLVRAARPDLRLTVVGSHPPPEVLAFGELPGVEVLGYVPDTAPYLDRAAISVAPLRYGAGMKGKVCEAMASGLPVVTTSVGAQGMRAVSGEHLMIADTPDEFARALLDLAGDAVLWEKIGLAGQRHMAGLCGPEVVERRLTELLEQVSLRRGRRTRGRAIFRAWGGMHGRYLTARQWLAVRLLRYGPVRALHRHYLRAWQVLEGRPGGGRNP